MAAYEPLTLAKFKENLGSGKYQAPGGARKAVGKSSWGDDEKKKGLKAIDAHFGEAAVPAPKKAPKVATTRAAKKEASAPASDTPRRGPGRPRGSKKAAVATPTVMASATEEIENASRRVGIVRTALEGLERAISLGAPKTGVAEIAGKAMPVLEGIVRDLLRLQNEHIEQPSVHGPNGTGSDTAEVYA